MTDRVELHWIPLGAGGRSVRFNGIVYEAVVARCQRRSRCDIVHAALTITLRGDRYTVEMTPVPDGRGAARGVVVVGPVGHRALGLLRRFRYEIRRWRNGVIPDLHHAVSGPVPVTDDAELTRRIFDALPAVPALVWGRDEQAAGEMWTCNSVISWALTDAGVDVDAVALPPHSRAPGWNAGRVAARHHESRPTGPTTLSPA